MNFGVSRDAMSRFFGPRSENRWDNFERKNRTTLVHDSLLCDLLGHGALY